MLSSTPIDRLTNRLGGGSFWIVFVNSAGKPPGFLPQSRREHERDQFDTVGGLAPILLVVACAYSVNQTDRSSCQQLNDGKRNVKRIPVNGCHRFRRRAFSRERLPSFSTSSVFP